MEYEKKENIIKIIFCGIIALIMIVIGIITLTNNQKLSYKEGRKLNTFSEINYKDALHSSFYNDITLAYADQLAFRENFVKYYYLINLQKYLGDVMIGKENELYLSPLITSNKEKYINNLKKVISNDMNKVAKDVKNSGAKFIFISIPRKDVVMTKYLPDTYINGTKDYLEYVDIIKQTISKDVVFIDAYNVFKKNQKDCYDVYYKTDHHINIRGGYYIFNSIIDVVNKDEIKVNKTKLEDDFDIESVVINGSYNRKIGQSVNAGKEELILTPKKSNLEYMRKDSGKVSNEKLLGRGDSYATAYMGGDFAETVVETNNKKTPNILFVGTSYTNVLESLATFKFNKVVSIDYRDNKTGKSINDYVKEHDIDYVVYICAQSTNPLAVASIKEQLGLKK